MNKIRVNSVVRFRPTRYRVVGYDGEDLHLVPEDGVGETLYFHHELFEEVKPPFPEYNTVWRDAKDRFWVVQSVDREKNLVWIVGPTHQPLGLSVEQFDAMYTRVL